MKAYHTEAKLQQDLSGGAIYMGLDLHRKSWHLTVRSVHQELAKMSLPPQWEALRKVLDRYGAARTAVVYEAGYFGFSLYDAIMAHGAQCVVTPPSLIPQESGNRVKTDKKDSSKLARLLAKGELRGVHVPDLQERSHRQVLRHRSAMIKARTRIQLQIKAFLTFHGVACPECTGKWSGVFVDSLHAIDFGDTFLQESFLSMLEQYAFFNNQILTSTRKLRAMSQSTLYKQRFTLLRTIPGVGLLTAMEVLLELGDVSRFSNAEKLAAFVGLTPSQHSSGDKIRLGHITSVGKGNLRGVLTEASWTLIRKDGAMKAKYERIKARAGGKRAIVAVAHNLLLRIRRILLDGVPYAVGVIG
jgi:transposase